YKSILLIFVAALFGLSIYLGRRIGTSFIPEMDSPQMSVTIELPEDGSKEELYSMTDLVMERIVEIDGIETVGAFKGEGMGGLMAQNSQDNILDLYIIIEDEMVGKNREIQEEILDSTADLDCNIRVNASAMDMASMVGPGI